VEVVATPDASSKSFSELFAGVSWGIENDFVILFLKKNNDYLDFFNFSVSGFSSIAPSKNTSLVSCIFLRKWY
jgi:hypothetical protein